MMSQNKKIALLISVFALAPVFAVAEEKLVNCSGMDCSFCSLIETFSLTSKWIFSISATVAVFLLVISGLYYIFSIGKYAANDKTIHPRLILLDLNLPKVSGLEILKLVKADENTKMIPIVILTSSSLQSSLILRLFDIQISHFGLSNCRKLASKDLSKFL